MSSRREWIQWACLGSASLGVMGRAWAAPFPEKPIKLIVPYPAGGGADQWARIVGGKAEKLFGQPIVFDYKPGASTTFKQRAGIAMNHVPYKGAAQYMADLVGGQVDLAVSTLGPAMPHVQTGRIRALAVSSAKRSGTLPDVPTIAEQGFEGFDEKPWNCFVTNAGVPAEALDKLRSVFRATMDDPEVVQALRKTGVEEIGQMPLALISEQMRLDNLKWGEVIRRAKITVDS
jgi:tripartite-type tricarboxylate transporter receptor subunit TctC